MTNDAQKSSVLSAPPTVEAGIWHCQNAYAALSLRDLLDARDQYHVHLMRHPNVIATAVGYYRIQKGDSWPGVKPVVKAEGRRTLANSELRPYSWPAVLVFVANWVEADEFGKGRKYDPREMVPRTLFLADGRQVPVCIIEAPRDPESPSAPPAVRYPLNNIGSGHPVLVEVQKREHVATIACLVTDGHRAYALTNRHVTGDAGQVVKSRIGGLPRAIGVASALQTTRVTFSELYPSWPGRATYATLDVGLIDIEDINLWTAKLKDGTVMGTMVDLSESEFPLALVGRQVQGYGAASQKIRGEIHGLFYRYKSRGGFEYVADFFIGPRTPSAAEPNQPSFVTQPGDSGTLWLLEPELDNAGSTDSVGDSKDLRPLAVQWGANQLYSGHTGHPQAYALATCLSTVCDRLDVDILRDWNLDQPDTWGAVGHFAIASRVAGALSGKVPKLASLMQNNATIISHDDDTILNSEFKGMGDDAFIPMADVPDFFWKHGNQGYARQFEGPNHFADMDQERPSDGADLLALCKDSKNIDAGFWASFYDSVEDLLNGGPISAQHRGLLPFRVWQIFDGLVEFVKAGDVAKFVCGAGVLTHYVGDACQPLHVSYRFDGDPRQATTHTVHHHDGTVSDTRVALGAGVHSAYEDTMVNGNRDEILKALNMTPSVTEAEYITTGSDAAKRTVDLMRSTLSRPSLNPESIIKRYLAVASDKANLAKAMWALFGEDTKAAMQDGAHLLAVLWESAWIQGGGESANLPTSALTPESAMAICEPSEFLPSCSINQIGQYLSKP